MKKILLCLPIIFTVNSSLASDDQINTAPIEPELDPIIQTAESIDPQQMLRGFDANKNGIRDDVEVKLYDLYSKKSEREFNLILKMARGFQKIFDYKPGSSSDYITSEIDSAMYCLKGDDDDNYDVFDYLDTIEISTFDTIPRKASYEKYKNTVTDNLLADDTEC